MSIVFFRRGHWNIYRIENEHLNNCGRFRAVDEVPLVIQDEFEEHSMHVDVEVHTDSDHSGSCIDSHDVVDISDKAIN